ncbi:MAG: SUMF1/EgtB/PvdO family nonheme iron enzyme [Aristaeellaceae bacterium]
MNFSPNFDLAALAIETVLPNNKVLYDDQGLPSVMVRIPKMTYKDLGLGDSTNVFPAFIVNGQEVDEIYISKYENVMYNNRAYSLPAKDPKTVINFDQAQTYCKNKGAGWHLMTRMEWAMLAQWCFHNNCMPKGNNDYGKDHSEVDRDHAIAATRETTGDYIGRVNLVLTGTGPLTWSHDGTAAGIWDLNGNVHEWVGGMRTVYGELQVLVNNNAADATHDQSATSDQWMCISAVDGSFITPDGNGTTENAIRARWKDSHWEWGIDTTPDGTTDLKGCQFEYVTCSSAIGDSAKLILQALGVFKYDTASGAYCTDYFYLRSYEAERAFCCGGNWSNGANAGVFYLSGGSSRSSAYSYIGFRSAFVKLPTA